jgi:hypothetical protein
MPDAGDIPVAVMVTSPIEHGCIVLIDGVLCEPDEMDRMMNELRRVAGHEQFLVVQVPPDVRMNVAGPDDLVDALKRLAREAVSGKTKEAGPRRTRGA